MSRGRKVQAPYTFYAQERSPLVAACMETVHRRIRHEAPQPKRPVLVIVATQPKKRLRKRYPLICHQCTAAFLGSHRAAKRVANGGVAYCSTTCHMAFKAALWRANHTLICHWEECQQTFLGSPRQAQKSKRGERFFHTKACGAYYTAKYKLNVPRVDWQAGAEPSTPSSGY